MRKLFAGGASAQQILARLQQMYLQTLHANDQSAGLQLLVLSDNPTDA